MVFESNVLLSKCCRSKSQVCLLFYVFVFVFNLIRVFCLKPVVASHMEDHDVSQERQRIQNNEAPSDILVVKNLTKRYRYKHLDVKILLKKNSV